MTAAGHRSAASDFVWRLFPASIFLTAWPMDHEAEGPQEEGGVRILIIDGEHSFRAGVLSPLVNVLELMRRVHNDVAVTSPMSTDSEDSNGPEALPSDYFDLIVGSGDGGWIAVMLGRLRMTVSQTTQTYLNIHSSVHHGTEHIDAEARSAELESRLKHLVETQSLSQNPDEKMWTSESKNLRCHTAILTMTAHNVTAPTLFRTYRTRNHRTKNCALWQAMRASSADPNLFTPARIGDQSYISASMIGHSNPVDYALSEAEGLFPGIPITCIVSLGAGHPGAISLAGSDMTSYAEAAINLAKDAEQKSQLAAKHLQAPKRTYYRFNVEQGLQHYLLGAGTGYEEARAHTMAYQRREEVHSLMDMVVAELLAPPPRRVKTQASFSSMSNSTHDMMLIQTSPSENSLPFPSTEPINIPIPRPQSDPGMLPPEQWPHISHQQYRILPPTPTPSPPALTSFVPGSMPPPPLGPFSSSPSHYPQYSRSRTDSERSGSSLPSVPSFGGRLSSSPPDIASAHIPENVRPSTHSVMRPLIRRGMACILCRRRKLRCDGMRPSCNQCVRNPGQSPCEYEAGLRPNHQKMLEDKIAALEAQVFDLEQRNLSTASNQSNVLFSPAHPSFPSSSSSFPSPFVQRLPYKEVNVEQELSDDVALSLLASFLLHASELGFFLNASEFSRSAMLPRTSEGHSRPTLALLYAVYLWGQHFLNSMDHSRIRALESQALQHGALDFAGSSHPHRVMHGIQANVLLSNYYLQDHRLSLAAYFAMGSASLVTSAGLDDQTRSNLPPPHNFTEARERTDAFWIVFSLTRILAIITRRTMPALVPLLEVFGTNATLPWPSPATIGSQNTSAPSLTPSHQHPVVSMFLQGREPVDAGIISILVVGVKAAAVLNEVTSLISRWVSKTIEFEAFRASYQCFSKILQDLKNYMPRLLQHDPTHVSPAKLLLLGSMIETAVIVLSQLFASSERACRVTCMGAAASVLNPGDIEVAKLLYVHPIMGPLWSTSIRALQDECVRLDHSPPLAESLSRDHLQRYIARGISFLRQHAKHNPPLQQFDSRSRSSSRGPPLSASPASQSPQSLSVSPSGLSPSSLSSDMYSTQPRSQPPSPTSWDFIDSERSISSFHSDIIPW